MRAKKFGVALSADAKKEVRAQRFGSNNSATSAATGRTTITINNSPTTGVCRNIIYVIQSNIKYIF